MPITLEPFDPSRDFVCAIAFRAAGQIWSKGQKFDKSTVTGRVLEQLYQQRRIKYPATQPKMAAGPKHAHRLLKGFIASVHAHVSRARPVEDPVEKHDQLIGEKEDEGLDPTDGGAGPADDEQNSEGASGTARDAPGAEESASAESGTASAPTEGEAGPALASSTDTTETATARTADPVEDEAAAAPDGEAATAAAASREAKVEQLMIDHSHAQLMKMADGLPGVNSKISKTKLAELLVDAGRA